MVGLSRGIVDFGGIEELPGGIAKLWKVLTLLQGAEGLWGGVDAAAGHLRCSRVPMR